MLFKPWSKPFDALLEAMRDQWGAEINDIEQTSSAPSRLGAGPGIFLYSEARLRRHDHTFGITLRESPPGATTIFEDEDNIEYLVLDVSLPRSSLHFYMQPMEFLSRCRARFGFRDGVLTNEPHLDQRYRTKVAGDDSLRLVQRQAVAAMVLALTPFDGLRLKHHELTWSREVRSKEQLTLHVLDPVLTKLRTLADEVTRFLP